VAWSRWLRSVSTSCAGPSLWRRLEPRTRGQPAQRARRGDVLHGRGCTDQISRGSSWRRPLSPPVKPPSSGFFSTNRRRPSRGSAVPGVGHSPSPRRPDRVTIRFVEPANAGRSDHSSGSHMSEDSRLVELIMFFTMLSVIFEIVSGERSPGSGPTGAGHGGATAGTGHVHARCRRRTRPCSGARLSAVIGRRNRSRGCARAGLLHHHLGGVPGGPVPGLARPLRALLVLAVSRLGTSKRALQICRRRECRPTPRRPRRPPARAAVGDIHGNRSL
jgi:hypothetical protein